ncbi:histidine kinase [Thermoanaerobacterium sp. PSU-2]|uniref:universal stress protein n=1 Tax=Thermoanaerobacterium sp. PSU-2 TaxID=1930849 RepID=UPI000A16310A|nr:universal stress protein [Thermoanaerobacterium sp. PSU-2]ORX22238.1 histidine kinase [Thermoanaerobacterium sp. PSU-2]HHV74811.1 sensor histidine kinase KdpD [Thermoanaerobacterium sp.]
MSDSFKRLTPEEALEIANKSQRGKLKIFLGYAPGVGKTYAMLDEANRRLKRGQDVVIGVVETYGRKETEAMIGDLEIIPKKEIIYKGTVQYEMDLDAILKRKPQVVLVDELAHTNVPGSKHNKRYEDVEEILQNGINVLSTLNIQHLESLNDTVKQITGITVRETIPDTIVNNADEIEVIDVTPDALQNRLKRGEVYNLDKVDQALKNFFRKGNLNALRELALRQSADEVDEDLEQYMKEHGIQENWETNEKIMVCISFNPLVKKLIRRGARRAHRFKCEWIVVYVECTNIFAKKPTKKDMEVLESHFKLAKQLGAEVVVLRGKSVSEELLKFAKERHITQIIMGHSNRRKWETLLRGSTVLKLINSAKNIEIHVIPYN